VPVKISSLPPSAAITVVQGGTSSGRGRTPARLDLAPGAYEITVEAPGYLSQTQQLTVEEGVHPDIDFRLDKLSTLHIEADVTGAAVKIDGKPEGVTPLSRELPAGLYKVEVTHGGYRAVERQVRVNAGDQISLMVSMPALPAERLLSIEPLPLLPAIASIDGDRIGAIPLERRIAAGAHHVEVTAPGRQTRAGEIKIPDDRDLTLKVHLEPKRTRTQKIVFWTLQGVASGLAVAGLTFGSLALSDLSSYNSHPEASTRHTGENHALTCDIVFATSAAIGIIGAIYYFATWPRHSRAEQQRTP
jgi:hypothetical protein